MSASPRSLPARERAALADLLDALGPEAPTCCEGWTTAHLAAHLAVRDRRPDALPGYGLELLPGGGRLAWWSHRLEDRLRASTPYAEVVEQVRNGPPAWSPMALPAAAAAFDTAEFAIHHEDVRRAQPGWEPRPLPREEQDQLWAGLALHARRAAGRRGLVLRRSDVPGAEKRIGNAGRTVTGEPLELMLWVSGRRDVARVEVS
ncbi:TIGR03085 family protein [Blastococcus sp. MG754426]|uniref:TIGR03085 family metal-binding protein n=1 Tax=unclassified Blastococcus TaxID=2619396 RepID=UPI001EEF95BF|nr:MULTISPECIES: TIGR03085 family metal-binding protein [unclassified Blastococcus]MCF6507822.1 TIGR03085 family protein [Blastococcus sp. MG754426]MCF6512362.1 TIGR03085 family protein [Blastococcus sp. MG754427]MCF6735402.1 TIGR03085 family protein [Blastococcus sp. KM273129]